MAFNIFTDFKDFDKPCDKVKPIIIADGHGFYGGHGFFGHGYYGHGYYGGQGFFGHGYYGHGYYGHGNYGHGFWGNGQGNGFFNRFW